MKTYVLRFDTWARRRKLFWRGLKALFTSSVVIKVTPSQSDEDVAKFKQDLGTLARSFDPSNGRDRFWDSADLQTKEFFSFLRSLKK